MIISPPSDWRPCIERILSRSALNLCNLSRFKGDRKLLQRGDNLRLSRAGQVHSLQMSNVQLDDSDQYTIKATNVAGSCTAHASLRVVGKIDLFSDSLIITDSMLVEICCVNKVITTTMIGSHIFVLAFTHLGLWGKLHDCSLHH